MNLKTICYLLKNEIEVKEFDSKVLDFILKELEEKQIQEIISYEKVLKLSKKYTDKEIRQTSNKFNVISIEELM